MAWDYHRNTGCILGILHFNYYFCLQKTKPEGTGETGNAGKTTNPTSAIFTWRSSNVSKSRCKKISSFFQHNQIKNRIQRRLMMSNFRHKYFLYRRIRWAMFHSSNAKMAWAESTRQESNYLRFPHLAVATWLEIPVLLAPTGTTRYQLFPTKEHCRTGLILMKIYKKKISTFSKTEKNYWPISGPKFEHF